MDNQIHTQRFSDLTPRFDQQLGVIEKFGSKQQARDAFIQVLRASGYRPGANSTWIKDGHAAVMLP